MSDSTTTSTGSTVWDGLSNSFLLTELESGAYTFLSAASNALVLLGGAVLLIRSRKKYTAHSRT
jgi:hypothetical protein